jgi:inner membrane protein
MKGTTHLLIGAAIGAAEGLFYQMDFKSGLLCLGIAAFSGLAADLDGNSILNRKVTQASKLIRGTVLVSGIMMATVLYLLFRYRGYANTEITGAAAALCILGMIFREGLIRNILLSLIGLSFVYAGVRYHMSWLAGFGVFVAAAPWFKHRGFTHTVWAAAYWGVLGWGLEHASGQPGIMVAAAAGYLSHLAADTLTPAGVKWLYPLAGKTFKLR